MPQREMHSTVIRFAICCQLRGISDVPTSTIRTEPTETVSTLMYGVVQCFFIPAIGEPRLRRCLVPAGDYFCHTSSEEFAPSVGAICPQRDYSNQERGSHE
jgi:hypothetical protein